VKKRFRRRSKEIILGKRKNSVIHETRFSKLMLALGIAYLFMWVFSLFILVPYYFSSEFNYSLYTDLPFMGTIVSELSEHYLPLPTFFIAFTFLYPLVSGFTFLSAWILLKISNRVPKMTLVRFLPQLLNTVALMLGVISFIPMIWIVRELGVIEGSIIQNWLITTLPLLYSYVQAGQVFVSSMITASKTWMVMYGQIGLFVAMVVASVISPIPNEVNLAFAGMTMDPVSVAISGALGSTVGGILCFYIARLGGRPLAEKFVKKETIASADGWFQRRGKWAILLGRFIPFVPFDVVSYFSGLTKISISTFAFLTFMGSIPRCLFYAYIGELVVEYNLPVLIIISVTILTIFLIHRLKKKKE